MEPFKAIINQDLIIFQINIILLTWTFVVLLIDKGIVTYRKDVLDQRKVAPAVVHHALQIVSSIQQNNECFLALRCRRLISKEFAQSF